jgi:hypothetical protein
MTPPFKNLHIAVKVVYIDLLTDSCRFRTGQDSGVGTDNNPIRLRRRFPRGHVEELP